MTDSITKILANAKRIFKTKDNNLKYIVIANDENGKETNYTLNFNYDGITVGRTVVNNNKIEVISNIHEYSREVFLFVLKNFNTLMGDINEFNNAINLTLNTIPTMVFSNSVFKKKIISDYDGETYVYDGDKYIDDFIAYNNENILINNNNYFTFLKITVEAGNIEIFDYLRFTYDEYMNNLNEKQMAILIYTACKRNPTFITKMKELDFTFGFEVLRLAVDNNDYEVLEYLRDREININAINGGLVYSPLITNILSYAFVRNNIGMIKYFLAIKNINLDIGFITAGIRQNPEVIESLFERDDIIDILQMRDIIGRSIAHEIAKNKDPKIVKLLFERYDIIDILKMRNRNDLSVAHVIAGNENPEVVKFLFEQSSEDIEYILNMTTTVYDNFAFNCNYSVLDRIIENKNPEVVKLLFERKENTIDVLNMRCGWEGCLFVAQIIAEKSKSPEIIKLLFQKTENLEEFLKLYNAEGFLVLRGIAENKNFEVAKFLFEREDIVDILKTVCYNSYIVHSIVENENPEVTKLLFEINNKDLIDILNLEPKDYGTILHVMAGNKNPEIIKLLLTHEELELKKEDVDLIKENFSKSRNSKNREIMNLLLARGLISANDAINEAKICTIC